MFLKNFLDHIIWLIFIAFFMLHAIVNYIRIPTYKIQAYDYPMILLVLMGVFVIIEIVIEIFRLRLKSEIKYNDIAKNKKDFRNQIHEIFVFIIPLLYVGMLNYMGFIVATGMFIIIYIRFLNYNNFKVIMTCAAAYMIVYLIFFVKFMFTPIPFGIGIFYNIHANIIGIMHKL